jgi:Na+/melibiose symporter-like transporter
MATFVDSLFAACSMLFLINLGLSFSTVLGEAMVVELSQLNKDSNNAAKDYVSLFFFCKYLGALFAAYMKGLLVEVLSVRTVFLIASFLPWLIIISGFIFVESRVQEGQVSNQVEEEKQQLNNLGEANQYGAISNQNEERLNTSQPQPIPGAKDLIKEFFKFLCQKFIIVPIIFLIIFMATPSYSDPFFYFITNQLKFTPSDLGKISFCSTLATLLAILLYKWYFKNFDFKCMITSGTILSFFFSFLGYLLVQRVNVRYGISDFVLLLFSSSFLSMLGELIMMPMLSLACMLCPKNLEGTVYSLFMSALNFGSILSGLNGSILTNWLGITSKDYHNLDKLILISNIMTLLPLPMLICIDNSYFHPETKDSTNELSTNIAKTGNLEQGNIVEAKKQNFENKE